VSSNMTLNDGDDIRLSFIGFVITINLAIYTALYLLKTNNIWLFSYKKFALATLLLFINYCIYAVYWKAEYATMPKDSTSIDNKAPRFMWHIVSFLFSLLCVIPIVYICSVLFIVLLGFNRSYCVVGFVVATVALTIILYYWHEKLFLRFHSILERFTNKHDLTEISSVSKEK
jgi:hypothetical protein